VDSDQFSMFLSFVKWNIKKKTEQKIILKLIPNILFICAVIVMVVWTSLITYNWNIFV